nr:MAG TPA: hypothetical protein [Caudoviricetes sp.]
MLFGVHNHLTGHYFTEEKVLFTLRGYIGNAVSAPQCLPTAAQFEGVHECSNYFKLLKGKRKSRLPIGSIVAGGR